jgi:hypothetical protein
MLPIKKCIYVQMMQGVQNCGKLTELASREELNRLMGSQFSQYKEIGLIQENPTRKYLLPPFTSLLMRIVRELSLVFSNYKRSLLLLIKKNQRFQGALKIRRFLWCNLILTLGIFYLEGLRNELDRNVTERTRYHAIPVALSQMYHQRDHDYTGWKEVAIPFQGREEIQDVIKRSHEKKVTLKSKPYYWLADDRGSSDLVNLSFRVFGETTRGLYNGYFCLFVISILVAALALRKSAGALALLNMIVIAYGSYLPNINSAVGHAIMWTNYRVHLSETRLFEIMGLVYFLQFLTGIAFNLRLRILEVIAFIVQGVIFGFLYSCRSSMGWLILCISIMSICFNIYFITKKVFYNKLVDKKSIYKIIWINCAAICLLIGVESSKGWHRLMENPCYLAVGGSRTFFHNALMGLNYHPLFPSKYRLTGIDDACVIDSVNENLQKGNRGTFDRQILLNSLGGHAFADWRGYEQAAKDFYIELWQKHPLQMLGNYAHKMVKAPVLSRESMSLKIRCSENDKNMKIKTFWPNPIAEEWVLVLLFPLIILSNCKKKLLAIGAYLSVGFIFSLIPSIAFYSGTLTMGGASVLIRMIAYLLLCVTCNRIIDLYLRIKNSSFNQIQKNQGSISIDLIVQIITTAAICALVIWLIFPHPTAK